MVEASPFEQSKPEHDAKMDQYAMQVNLHMSARNLKKVDAFSKSDPQCIVYEKQTNGQYKQIGQTEQIKNNQDPMF